MLAYIIRRVLYAFPILLGVNLLLFGLFFSVKTPDDMARNILGEKRVKQEDINKWKREHGYHLPMVKNPEESGFGYFTQTIFWQKSMNLFLFQFGKSDKNAVNISDDIVNKIPYSLALTLPAFICGIFLNLFFAMIVAFYRGTYVDTFALIVCVIMMSISALFYIIGGQFVISKVLKLLPISGIDTGWYMLKFLMMPIVISLVAGIGGGVRYYRTIFLEEINKDYVRTARAKGLSERVVLFKHALKNAMLPILTNVIVSIPFLIMGSLLMENFFGIPGLGSYTFDAIQSSDFAVIRAMVFLSSVLYIIGLIMVDISYTLVDPRIRLG